MHTLMRGTQFLKRILGLDRAIAFTVLARGWSILSGALTILLIARFMSSVEQGYYYTFSSLVSMQVVFELGFSFVVLQLAAHEGSLLHILPSGVVTGSTEAYSRLASILQKSVRWYFVASILMGWILIAVGFHFFFTYSHTAHPPSWRFPWLCLVFSVVFTFQMDPVFSFLEGCGFVAQVARMRMTQAIAGTVLAWLAVTHHLGLFAPAGVVAGQAIAGLAFLLSKKQLLLSLLRHDPGANTVGWRTEIWPFQWRIAVSFFCSYFVFPLFNPVLFAYRGAAEAGQMGMSLAVAAALGNVAYAWMNTKAAPFGSMVAQRDFENLDRVFFRTLVQSSLLLLTGEVTFLGVFLWTERHYPMLVSRMLPSQVLAFLLAAIFLNHILYSEALYIRAHKREPFLVLSIAVAALLAASTLLTGRRWGAAGLAVGYFVVGGVVNLAGGTYIFQRSRKLWHVRTETEMRADNPILEEWTGSEVIHVGYPESATADRAEPSNQIPRS